MMRLRHLFVLLIAVLALACTKELPPNPFDDPANQAPIDSSAIATLDLNTFAGLHYHVFSPTCANSGCHDGTFEPDFRTIEGAYNTLVYQPVIKNNATGDFTYRVDPGRAENSVLIERLVNDIDGSSGIMPLSVDPGSDWSAKKDEYIQHIRNWINNGAKDMFGNNPTKGNQEPKMLGVVAFADGSNTPLARNPGNGAIRVPATTQSLSIWVALSDDVTAVTQLGYNKIKFSLTRDDFSTATAESLSVSTNPQQEEGYFGSTVNYHHQYTLLQPGQWGPIGTTVFFRVYVQDSQHNPTEIPESGSFNYIKAYFAFELI